MSDPKEKLVMAKELVDYFAERGVSIHYAYARAIIRACPQAVRARYVRPTDAWTRWAMDPALRPFGRPPAPGENRTLGEIPGNS